jgi:hypothetical protein
MWERICEKARFKKHLLVHLNSKTFQCNICDAKLTSNGSFQFHSQTKHGIGSKEFKCGKCSFQSANHKELKLHRSKVHLRLFCKICDQNFMDKTKFNSHQKVHENFDVNDGKLKCKICEFKCESFRGFQFHFKYVHASQLKNFECEICGKKLRSVQNLNNYKSTHFRTRKYCDHCPKTFQSKSFLLKHLKQNHINSMKVLKCKLCLYKTKAKENFKKHESIHNKTFTCPNCDKKFAFKWNLNKHLKTHGDAKEYK